MHSFPADRVDRLCVISVAKMKVGTREEERARTDLCGLVNPIDEAFSVEQIQANPKIIVQEKGMGWSHSKWSKSD